MPRFSSRSRRDGRVRYKKPWTRWFVNFILLTALAAGALAAMAYIPPYWRSWKAQSAVKDVASQTYSRRSRKDSWNQVLGDIRSRIRKKMTGIVGTDQAAASLRVNVSKDDDSSWIRIHVTWDDLAEFPLIHEKRILHFSIQAKAATK